MALTYKTCPKCAHERTSSETAGEAACPACGLIFEKYLQSRLSRSALRQQRPAPVDGDEDHDSLPARAKDILFHVPDRVEASHVYARAVLLAVLVVYGLTLAAMDIPSWAMAASLMHLPMVPIHEFGHFLFSPFGEFMMLLGGSLFQAGLPLVFAGIFLVRKRDPFAAAVTLWWSAVAVMDIAPYVYDAQQPVHVLLTGRTGDSGAHDFIDVLGDLGLLAHAQSVGYGVHRFGVAMLVASLAWAAWIVWRQFAVRADMRI